MSIKLKHIGKSQALRCMLGDSLHDCRITACYGLVLLFIYDLEQCRNCPYILPYYSLKEHLREWEEVERTGGEYDL